MSFTRHYAKYCTSDSTCNHCNSRKNIYSHYLIPLCAKTFLSPLTLSFNFIKTTHRISWTINNSKWQSVSYIRATPVIITMVLVNLLIGKWTFHNTVQNRMWYISIIEDAKRTTNQSICRTIGDKRRLKEYKNGSIVC